MKYFFIPVLLLSFIHLTAQYAPPAGQPGSTAIHKDSAIFTHWAVSCTVQRGYLDISQPGTGMVTYGEQSNATGVADNTVVSLGDGGVAILTFDKPVTNGEGFDFAVFENGFSDTFLELAFVEVSSNGVDFFRFDPVSLTQTNEQIGGFGELNTEKINNLAGKYRVEYGTPFDLQELAGTPGLDINNITHIKIVDVVGCIQDNYATFDSQGNKINDPWPTPFESGGFDLDAVGVINSVNGITENEKERFKAFVFPNPAGKRNNRVYVEVPDKTPVNKISVYDMQGNCLRTIKITGYRLGMATVDVTFLSPGIYILKAVTGNGIFTGKIVKQ